MIRLLFSFSTFFHVLGRDRFGSSRTVCSLCRTRTRLFVCERVLRQETSIVRISGIGAIELRVLVSSSCTESPLQSCVDRAETLADFRCCRTPTWPELALWLRSPFGRSCVQSSGTVSRLKDRRTCGAGVDAELLYLGLDSEKFCFNGGRYCPRG